MCLYAPIIPSKPTPASLPPPTSTEPDNKIILLLKYLVILCFPFWSAALTFLLVPQACSSPYLTSCHLDPASSLYSRKTLDENLCYNRCCTYSFNTIFSLLLVFAIYLLIRQQIVARRNPPAKKNKSLPCV